MIDNDNDGENKDEDEKKMVSIQKQTVQQIVSQNKWILPKYYQHEIHSIMSSHLVIHYYHPDEWTE